MLGSRYSLEGGFNIDLVKQILPNPPLIKEGIVLKQLEVLRKPLPLLKGDRGGFKI